ncbi:MAG: multicopper oxidase domain-containing protein [Bacillota bacterium]|nr:multicopper oxidase domain-containing protein [Bacillota bacterium]MDW7677922.1 multicopper oxidase domain-containing protein [Bacillota bacterium]
MTNTTNKTARNHHVLKKTIFLMILLMGFLFLLQGCNAPQPTASEPERVEPERQGNPLAVPVLLEDQNPSPDVTEYELNAQVGEMTFFPGMTTTTLGYNGNYLGPVLKMRRGEQINVTVNNQLSEATTVHWHGLDLPGEADGGPHQPIQPGESWQPSFVVDQPAATLWYHPHPHLETAPQVYYGLAGLVYIEDEVSDALNIPKDYGVNDFPLVVQDRNFRQDGAFLYDLDMMGLVPGDTVLVNGTVDPYLEVNREKVRLRLLNGSNFETFRFRLDNGQDFHQIASDGGFLESPVVRDSLFMAPGERVEVIVDFSEVRTNTVDLMAGDYEILRFYVMDEAGLDTEIPETLTTIPDIPLGETPTTRVFVLENMGIRGTINGKTFHMDRIDEEVPLNETELWVVRSRGGMMMMQSDGHPFHVHGTQFQVASRNGTPPPPEERGYKDTIFVNAGEEVVIKVRFKHEGLYMYHCHMLEHEDFGMMGQFLVSP